MIHLMIHLIIMTQNYNYSTVITPLVTYAELDFL